MYWVRSHFLSIMWIEHVYNFYAVDYWDLKKVTGNWDAQCKAPVQCYIGNAQQYPAQHWLYLGIPRHWWAWLTYSHSDPVCISGYLLGSEFEFLNPDPNSDAYHEMTFTMRPSMSEQPYRKRSPIKRNHFLWWRASTCQAGRLSVSCTLCAPSNEPHWQPSRQTTIRVFTV